MRFRQYLILPDVHAPWHNRVLLKKVCQLIIDVKPHGLILSGDFLDLYSIASHNRGKTVGGWDLGKEYEVGRKVMGDLLSAGKKTVKRHYIYGNHEDRFKRMMNESENNKLGRSVGSPEDALRLRESGFDVLTDWKDDSVLLGRDCEVGHGQFCGRNPCRTHFEKHEGTIVFGHTHGFASYVSGRRGAYNIGYLGDKMADGFKYVPLSVRRMWTNGFSFVNVLDDGNHVVDPVQCWNNKFVFNGKLY